MNEDQFQQLEIEAFRNSAQRNRDVEQLGTQTPIAQEEDTPERSFLGTIYQNIKGGLITDDDSLLNTVDAIASGVGRGVNELIKSATIGPYQLLPTPNPDEPLIPEEVLGDRHSGLLGLVEGASQFATGFLPFSRGLQAMGLTQTFLRGAAAGALTDAFAFDPWEDRVANLVQDHFPDFAQNAVTDFLAADEDDSEALGRVKNALEGLVLGTTIDGLILGLKFMKARRAVRNGKLDPEEAAKQLDAAIDEAEGVERIQAAAVLDLQGNQHIGMSHADAYRAAGIDPENASGALEGFVTDRGRFVSRKEAKELAERAKQLKEATDDPELRSEDTDLDLGEGTELRHDKSDGPVRIEVNAETGETLLKVSDDAPESVRQLVPDEGITFSNPAVAERYAASVNYAARRARLPVDGITDEAREQIRIVARRIAENPTIEDITNLVNGIDINFNYLAGNKDGKAIINAVSEVFADEILPAANRSSDGFGVSNEMAARMAEGLVNGASGEAIWTMIRSTRESLDEALPVLLGTRLYLTGLGKEAARIGHMLDMEPDNPVMMDLFGEVMERLVSIQTQFAGARAGSGRLQQSFKIGITPEGHFDVPGTPRRVELDIPGRENPVTMRKLDEQLRTVEDMAGVSREGDEAQLQQAAADLDGMPKGRIRENVRKFRSIRGLPKDVLRALARQAYFLDGDPQAILDILVKEHEVVKDAAVARTMQEKRTIWDRLMTYRVNAMLSGPVTHAVNLTSNLLNTFFVPAEIILGGLNKAAGDIITGNRPDFALARQGMDMAIGSFLFAKDAARMAMKTWRKKMNMLDPHHAVDEGIVKFQDMPTTGAKIGYVASTAVRTPTRALMTSDEFFKQLQYRSHVRSQSIRRSRALGIKDPEEIAKRWKEDVEESITSSGRGVNPLALQHTRYSTFTNDVGDYGFGGALKKSDWKVMQFIMPFQRTPVQIARFNMQRFPALGAFQRQMREDIAAGGERRAIALARQEVSAVLWSMGLMGVLEGSITGRGPSDPELRRQWRDNGHEPYTITLPNGYRVHYRRLEPIGTAIGMVADVAQMLGELDEVDAEKAVYAVMASLSQALGAKQFLMGITEAFEALAASDEQGIRKWEKFWTSAAGSFAPNLLRQVDPNGFYRETEGLIEELMSRTPGFSETLEPRRNAFGEKITKPPFYFLRSVNPFTVFKPIEGPIEAMDELIEIGRSLPEKSHLMHNGEINLKDRDRYSERDGQSPYDRWHELVSNPTWGEPPLRKAIEKVVTSEEFKSAPKGNEYRPGGKKFDMVARVHQKYFDKAWKQVLEEYPTLKRDLTEFIPEMERAAAEGRDPDAIREKYGFDVGGIFGIF